MGFLDNLFRRGGKEESKEKIPSTESVMPKAEAVVPLPKVESIPDYVVEKSMGRTILSIPRSKMDKIGGRDVVRGFFREIYGGSDPAWGFDHGTCYSVEFTELPRVNVDAAIEKMKQMIDERVQQS